MKAWKCVPAACSAVYSLGAVRTLAPAPLQLDLDEAVTAYRGCKKRLLLLGYNATLTTAIEAPRQPKKHFDQIQALSRMNPAAYSAIAALSRDPTVEIVISLVLPRGVASGGVWRPEAVARQWNGVIVPVPSR